MSADNWAVCPRCLQNVHRDAKSERARAGEAYGKVSLEEWLQLNEAAERAEKFASSYDKQTLREDYEIGIDEDGIFAVNYSGNCSVCQLSYSFEDDVRVVSLKTGDPS